MGNKRICDDLFVRSGGNRELNSLRWDIVAYNSEGVDDRNKWYAYFIDKYEVEVQTSVPHQLTNEELVSGISRGVKFDKKKKKYLAVFDTGYKNRHRWDEYSSFGLNQIVGDD